MVNAQQCGICDTLPEPEVHSSTSNSNTLCHGILLVTMLITTITILYYFTFIVIHWYVAYHTHAICGMYSHTIWSHDHFTWLPSMPFWPYDMLFWKRYIRLLEFVCNIVPFPHLNIIFQLFKHQCIPLENSVIKPWQKWKPKCLSGAWSPTTLCGQASHTTQLIGFPQNKDKTHWKRSTVDYWVHS